MTGSSKASLFGLFPFSVKVSGSLAAKRLISYKLTLSVGSLGPAAGKSNENQANSKIYSVESHNNEPEEAEGSAGKTAELGDNSQWVCHCE